MGDKRQVIQSYPALNEIERKKISYKRLNAFTKWLGILIAISLCIGGINGILNAELCGYPRGGARLCFYGIQAQVKGAMTLVFGLLIGTRILFKASQFRTITLWLLGLVAAGAYITSLLL